MTDLDAELRFHRLLEEALSLEDAERQAFLAALEMDEPDVVNELRLCLEDEDDDLMGDFLELPAVDPEDISTAASLHRVKGPVPQPRRGPAPAEWQVKIEGPKRVGPYVPLEPVGSGGMGKVYGARRDAEEALGEQPTVALKVLRGRLGDAAAQGRFIARVRRLGELSHANLAAILDGGIGEGGHPYYGMEWVDGPMITRFCQQQTSPIAARLDLALQVCRGLECAHHHGAMHLGLKPSNILVTTVAGKACPKITDIGIADALDHRLTESAVLTRGGLDMALYISPEAIDGSRGEVDALSDVYALGVLLFELLVGVLPMATEGASLIQVVQTILQGESTQAVERWRSLDEATRQALAAERGTVAADLEAFLQGPVQDVLHHAMAKDRGERLGTVGALRRRLETIAETL